MRRRGVVKRSMSISMVRMIGLSLLALSVLVILFGVHGADLGMPGIAATLCVLMGIALLVAGTVLYAVVRER